MISDVEKRSQDRGIEPTSGRMIVCMRNTNFPLGNFHRENGTTFSGIPFIPENFQWNEPKSRVPFTTRPEFPEFFGKWKTPNGKDEPAEPDSQESLQQLAGQTIFAKFERKFPY